MNDFQDFLQKVLAPVQSDTDAQPSPAAPAPKPETVAPTPVPFDELERRYVKVMNALLEDAQAREAVAVFAEVVAWKLAVVAYHWGPQATGDVLRRFGDHLDNIAKTAQAQREADEAKEAGSQPN